MTPTFDSTSQFDRQFRRLTKAERAAFKKAVRKLVEDLRIAKGFRKSLRVKGFQGKSGTFEMTWAADGRALFVFGEEILKREAHVVWLNIGGHEIFERE